MEEHKCLALIILELASLLEHHQSQDQLFPHFATHLKEIVHNFYLFAHLKTRMRQKDWMHVNKKKKKYLTKITCLMNAFISMKDCGQTPICLCLANIPLNEASNTNSCILWPILGGGRKVDFKWTLPFCQNH
jgi:hypothetical protein